MEAVTADCITRRKQVFGFTRIVLNIK